MTVTTWTSAFIFAVIAGIVAGALVGRIRLMWEREEGPGLILRAALLGGMGAAVIFGAAATFHGVLYFLLGPIAPVAVLKFTILAVVLLALVFLLP
jgi:hypothetical protein